LKKILHVLNSFFIVKLKKCIYCFALNLITKIYVFNYTRSKSTARLVLPFLINLHWQIVKLFSLTSVWPIRCSKRVLLLSVLVNPSKNIDWNKILTNVWKITCEETLYTICVYIYIIDYKTYWWMSKVNSYLC